MSYTHLLPWQLLTRWHGLCLTHQLDRRYDVQLLREEFDAIADRYQFKTHFRYAEGWEGISLVAAGGDPFQDEGVEGAYEKTEVLKHAPYMERIIDEFACEKRRVRLQHLPPGFEVYWHVDSRETLDRGLARLHLPLETNERVDSQICHEDYRWAAGELWYGDYSFPHRVANRSDRSRIHFVIDVVRNDWVDALFGTVAEEQRALRARVRPRVYQVFRYAHRYPLRVRKRVQRMLGAPAAP